jgi:hypothetical protein
MRARDSNQEDYLLRIIKQAAEALRRLREQLEGSAGASETVRADAQQAISQLLGDQAALLSRLDARTAVQLLGNAQKQALWAELLDLQADSCAAVGRSDQAESLRVRAQSIRDAPSPEFMPNSST